MRGPESIRSDSLPRLLSVDALRGCAALLVLLLHTGRDVGALKVLKPLAAYGWSGVGLFLVLSGFSIHFRWAASEVPHHQFTHRGFFRRRLFRLYPTYLAAVLLTMLLTAALGIPFSSPVPWVLANGNVPGWVIALDQILILPANIVNIAFVGVAWSLALEIQLYVVYALIVKRLRQVGIVRIVLATLVVALVFRVLSEVITSSMPVGQFFPGGRATELSRVLYSQLPARAFEWFLGVLAAEAYFGRVKLPRWSRSPVLAVALIVVAALLFRHPLGATSLNGHYFRVSDVVLDPLVGLGYFALLLAIVTREPQLRAQRVADRVIRVLGWVGLFSYSLYLLHPILLATAAKLTADVHMTGTLQTVVMLALVLATSWGFSRVIERPFITGDGDRWVLVRLSRLRRRFAALSASAPAP